MHHVTLPDKTTLYVKDWGAGDPVILLSGWPLSADSWDDQAMVIAGSGYRVIAYDRRGFGRSSQPWGGYDYDTLADDLAAVIQQTGAQKATLVESHQGRLCFVYRHFPRMEVHPHAEEAAEAAEAAAAQGRFWEGIVCCSRRSTTWACSP